MSDVKPAVVKMHCPSCSKKLGFPAQAVGKKAKCPTCAHVFKVAAPAGSAAVPAAPPARVMPPPPPPPPRAAEENSLFALAAIEGSGEEVELTPEEAARAQALTAATAAAHQAALAGAAAPPTVPERTGKTTHRGSSAREGGAGIDRMPSAVVMLSKGCLFSAAGALIGAFLWCGVAKALDCELGYVAWAVGLLAGGGMQLGMRAQTNLAGVIAALFAVGGIFIGKVMVIAWVVFPMIAKEAAAEKVKLETSIKYQIETLTDVEYEKILKDRKLDPEEAGEEQLQKARNDAESRVKGWGAEKIRSEFAKHKASDEYKSVSLEDLPTGPLAVIVAVVSLGLFDLLFVVLSAVSAFVIGSGRTFNAGAR
jgi:hypothetical protein